MSKLTACSACGGNVSINADKCVHCGEPNKGSSSDRTENSRWTPTEGATAFLILLFFPVGLFYMWRQQYWSKFTRIVLTGVFGTLFMASISNDPERSRSSSAAFSSPVKPIVDLSYFEIRNNLNNMTEAQFKGYARSLVGKRVRWSGYVDDVDEGFLGGFEVWVDMDSPNDPASVQDVYFDIDKSKALILRRDSKITIEGDIESVIGLLGATAQVNLGAVRYWGGT